MKPRLEEYLSSHQLLFRIVSSSLKIGRQLTRHVTFFDVTFQLLTLKADVRVIQGKLGGQRLSSSQKLGDVRVRILANALKFGVSIK